MTGEEFLNKVRAIKTITDIHWQVKGDVLDPDEAKVIIIADGEKIELSFPLHPLDPKYDKDHEFFQSVAIGLIINKFSEQIGNSFRTNIGADIAKAVNFSRIQIKKGGKEND